MSSGTHGSQGGARTDSITLPPDREHGDTTAATHRVTISKADLVDISGNPIARELAVTLEDVLGRYIDQLYGAGHGGLSLEEETVIHRARHLLGRVGVIHHDPRE
jgi:hypothetical protein